MKWIQLSLLMTLFALSACRGGGEIKCSEDEYYQRATASPRVKAPEGLDDLEPLKEIPLPEASPQADKEGAGRCLERPPQADEGS